MMYQPPPAHRSIANLHFRTCCSFSKKGVDIHQANHMESIDIVIPFQPLLIEIAKYFDFHEPYYQMLSPAQNSVCVKIQSKSDDTELTYIREVANSIEGSRELAAQRAVRDLIQKFKIIVEDFTYHHEQETDRCCRLYRLKRIELEQIAQRTTLTELEETVPMSPQGYIHFYLDYMSILRKIFTSIPIKCKKLQTVEHYPGSYTSWITIESPQSYSKNQKLIGPCSSTLALAKDHLAKKAINYLIPAYNLHMVDANYGSLGSKSTEIMLELECGSYLTTRALLFGMNEEPVLSSLIEEEDSLSIEGVVSYTPPAHLKLTQSEAATLPAYSAVCVARRVLSFQDA